MVARTLLAWIRHSVETVRAKEFQGSQTHISPSFSRHMRSVRARARSRWHFRRADDGLRVGVIKVRWRAGPAHYRVYV